jgi:hypothetical protein
MRLSMAETFVVGNAHPTATVTSYQPDTQCSRVETQTYVVGNAHPTVIPSYPNTQCSRVETIDKIIEPTIAGIIPLI